MQSRFGRRDQVDTLDEQEQEELIQDLRVENQAANKSFRFFVSVLCLVPTPIFAVLITRNTLLPYILAISSLVMTSFTLFYLPDECLDNLDGPLARFLPLLNGLLALVVWLMASIRSGRKSSYVLGHLCDISMIPLIMLSLSMVIRWTAARTEASIRILELKKYKLKGA